MIYHKLRITTENKYWKGYFNFAERFLSEGEEILFSEAYKKGNVSDLKIQALQNGMVIRDENLFKLNMPMFSIVERVLLIRGDLVANNTFSELNGISLIEVKVDGTFWHNYKLLYFDTALDCVDETNSKRADIEFLSKLVLDKSKIPKQTEGFYLDNWNRYNKFTSIVGQKTKEKLLMLKEANKFLIFDKLE